MSSRWLKNFFALGACLCLPVFNLAGQTFTVATYNLENYLDVPSGTRAAKTPESKTRIRESILALKPDVLALQEMGSTNALLELRDTLRASGLDYPYWEHVTGFDTNIHVAILSRLPFGARRPHTNESYLLNGSRLHVSRGFAEVDVRVSASYTFTLINAHLKSKLPSPVADEAGMRVEESRLLREKIDARLKAEPKANLVVLGDFNDTINSRAMRSLLGHGRNALTDTRPTEQSALETTAPVASTARNAAREVAWTYYYAAEDAYSRIDYILLSPGMAREWVPARTFVLNLPRWGIASDHRPLIATFVAEDK